MKLLKKWERYRMDSQEVRQAIKDDFRDYLQDLKYITNIDSGTGHKAGSSQIAAFLKGRLEALGGEVELRENERAVYTIARFKGKGAAKFLLIGHTDTVFSVGEANRRPFRLNEKLQAYGPGVGDDKASVIEMVYCMKVLQKLNFNQYGEITLFFSGEEETGSAFAEEMIKELAQTAHIALILDTAPPDFGLTTCRKGRSVYELKVTGKSGHAGNSPGSSASAIMELAYQITKLNQLASPLTEEIPPISINIGTIYSSNDKINVVPAEASAKLEVRAFALSDLEKIDEAIKQNARRVTMNGTAVEVLGGIEQIPLERNDQNNRLIEIYKDIVHTEYGIAVQEEKAGGVTDGNLTAAFIPTLDGLGIENYNEHTDEERVDLNTVEPRLVALLLFLQKVCQSDILNFIQKKS